MVWVGFQTMNKTMNRTMIHKPWAKPLTIIQGLTLSTIRSSSFYSLPGYWLTDLFPSSGCSNLQSREQTSCRRWRIKTRWKDWIRFLIHIFEIITHKKKVWRQNPSSWWRLLIEEKKFEFQWIWNLNWIKYFPLENFEMLLSGVVGFNFLQVKFEQQ